MRFVIILLVIQARIIRFLSKLLKKGQGTASSGWIVEKYLRSILRYYNKKYTRTIYITGTNGKTTTRSILTHILRNSGYTVCTNAGGANILRGIAAVLLLDTDLLGRVQSNMLVLEVEEATMPHLASLIAADTTLITNIARDQLDVYGEVDITKRYIQSALNQMPHTHCIINADDPQLMTLSASGEAVRLAKAEKKKNTLKYEETNEKSIYHITFTSLLSSQSPQKLCIKKEGEGGKKVCFEQTIPGIFNTLNYGIAIRAARTCSISLDNIQSALKTIQPVFGRGEKLRTANTQHTLFLVKNPMGFEAVLDQGNAQHCVIGIQDKIADGTDVSWLWDVNFEELLCNPLSIICSGTRGDDMYVRLHQAKRSQNSEYSVSTMNLSRELVVYLLTTQKPHVIYGTYTFIMELRKLLQDTLDLPAIDSRQF